MGHDGFLIHGCVSKPVQHLSHFITTAPQEKLPRWWNSPGAAISATCVQRGNGESLDGWGEPRSISSWILDSNEILSGWHSWHEKYQNLPKKLTPTPRVRTAVGKSSAQYK